MQIPLSVEILDQYFSALYARNLGQVDLTQGFYLQIPRF